MDTLFFNALLVQIAVFVIAVMSKNLPGKYMHYFLLFLLCSITATHIFAFNTDAEDMYIALRYVKNFVDGNGLVFNTFDKVEGYSDFLWVMLIAGIHKLFQTDIPLTARYLSMLFSIIVAVYTYYLTYSFTRQKLLSYLAAFLVSVSGSFACYGLSGLENPLFALLILIIIQLTYRQKWMWAGLLIGLIIMVRPEGCIIYLPVALYIFMGENNRNEKFRNYFITIVAAAAIVIPWTVWRVFYYGYFIPNTIAAKMGMDTFYQVKSGLQYSGKFLIVVSAPCLVLLLLPLINFFLRKQKLNVLSSDRLLIFVLSIAAIFIFFYSYAGGDWMPGWRFYSSLVPLFSIILVLIWNRCIFLTDTGMMLKPGWIILLFAFCGYAQIRTSFKNENMIPRVRLWSNQVNGLKVIGKWFHECLPPNTLIATLPNGAFSYYNELPTLDYLGLTDNNVGRFGKKQKQGWPGHIASNVEYILNQKPGIIAKMFGAGFENRIYASSEFPGYDITTFSFPADTNPLGNYVNINIRSERKEEIIQLLMKNPGVKLVQSIPSKSNSLAL